MLRLNMGWRKAARDLWLNKPRTILVVLAIAIGIFAVGSVLSAYSILTREMDRNYLSTNPASAIFTVTSVNDATSKVSDLPDIAQVEARRQVGGRIEVAENEWWSILLFVIEDFNDLRINTFTSERGVSEPAEGEILIERSALHPLTIAYSPLAYGSWLLITLVLAAVACALPARRATEVPVSSALVY